MPKIPTYIHQYLQQNSAYFQHFAFIKTNSCGLIEEIIGNLSDFGVKFSEKNNKIFDILDCLEGIFPLKQNILVLPNIQTEHQNFIDIHLIQDKKLIWVILHNKTPQIESIRQHLQLQNETLLQTQKQTLINDSLISLVFEKLDILVLSQIKEQIFRLAAPVPEWFKELHPNLQNNQLNLVNIFPFLDFFFTECQKYWKNPIQKNIESEMWIESTPSQTLYLKANALSLKEINLVLIGQLAHANIFQKIIQQIRQEKLKK